VQMILHGVRTAGSWSFWYEVHLKCGGFNVRDRLCVQELEEQFAQYEDSIDPVARQQLAAAVQRGILENHYLVPVSRHVFATPSAHAWRRKICRDSFIDGFELYLQRE
jgi:hypothetical protein